ncbi:MAG: tyrosine-type recombinase/integrase, partial [Candidatus Omnitrophota bacterium]
RDLPIPTRFVSVLEKYLEIRQRLIDRLGVDSGYLFMNKSGNSLSRRSVESLFKKLERLYFADYNENIRIYPHLLRHTFALNKLKSLNGDLPQLSRLLGHVGLGHVQRYTVPSDVDMENAMDG